GPTTTAVIQAVAASLPSTVTTKLVFDRELLLTPRSPMGERENRTGQGLSRFYAVSKPAKPLDPRSPRKQKTRHSENPPVELPVGWVMDSREHAIPPVAAPSTTAAAPVAPRPPVTTVTAATMATTTSSQSQPVVAIKPTLRSISFSG